MNRHLSAHFFAISNAKMNSDSQTCAYRLFLVFTASPAFSSVFWYTKLASAESAATSFFNVRKHIPQRPCSCMTCGARPQKCTSVLQWEHLHCVSNLGEVQDVKQMPNLNFENPIAWTCLRLYEYCRIIYSIEMDWLQIKIFLMSTVFILNIQTNVSLSVLW